MAALGIAGFAEPQHEQLLLQWCLGSAGGLQGSPIPVSVGLSHVRGPFAVVEGMSPQQRGFPAALQNLQILGKTEQDLNFHFCTLSICRDN